MLRPPTITQRLRSVAEALFDIADELDRLDLDERPPRRSLRARMATVVSEIADAISSGTPKNDAIALTAARAGVDLSDAHFAWSRSEKQREAQDLYARRYMARNLMAYGIDRDTVAELVGCHPNHVPRMIAALREEERAAGGRAALDRPPAALPASEPADDHASP